MKDLEEKIKNKMNMLLNDSVKYHDDYHFGEEEKISKSIKNYADALKSLDDIESFRKLLAVEKMEQVMNIPLTIDTNGLRWGKNDIT